MYEYLLTVRSLIAFLSLVSLLHAQTARTNKDPEFDESVTRVLAAKCLSCHRGSEPTAGLDLTRRSSALTGGDSGVSLVPGDVESSYLWHLVENDEMPPDEPLSPAEKQTIRDWIQDGAQWGSDPIDPLAYTSERRAGYDWWSLQPLSQPRPPLSQTNKWINNEIDRFVLARLQHHDLQPSPRAAPRTLLRRVYIDLIGLPPSADSMDQFAADPSQESYLRVVDDLLNSKHYGERWARHWMDIARFGESDGFEYNRPRNNAWHYRDWLIRAFNDDLPYDRFARMQLAGDAIQPESWAGAAAVGFLVAGTHNTVLGADPLMKLTAKHDELEELAGTIGQAFLGMTINCARCHDHKFDPISSREYYSFVAALDGIQHGERSVPRIPEALSPHSESSGHNSATSGRDIEAMSTQVYTVVSSQPGVMHDFPRGDLSSPGQEVQPGGFAAIQNLSSTFALKEHSSDRQRRLKLANWITHRENALFHRVAVNRFWHYHFGRGLVNTPSDFGFNGGRPSHPQLLEWLSVWFRQHRYSMKELHRLIVTSATYQQSSQQREDALLVDRANRLLWRQNPRRVEGEAFRDSVLVATGRLNRDQFGPGFRDVTVVEVPPAFYYSPIDPPGREFERRAIYRWHVRGQRSALLDTFDCPDPSTKTPSRLVTTTPSQALSQWNDSFILRMSERLAKRVKDEANDDRQLQIALTWRYVLARSPSKDETEFATQLVTKHGLDLLCRVLFNSNEFIVID